MYLLNTNNLQVGDIVLTADDEWVSRKIRKHTKGDFSHAMLYVADHGYIHSDSDGVHSGNTQRLLIKDVSHAKAFRLKTVSLTTVEKACLFARSEIGKQYSAPEAGLSRIMRKSSISEIANRQFCSRLVAQAYKYAGVDLVTNPDYCYPSDIGLSLLLEPVNDPLRLAHPKEIEFAISTNPLNEQTKTTNSILDKVRKLSGRDIQTYQDVADLLVEAPQYDERVCGILQSSGYLDFWKQDVAKNPWRYSSAAFLASPMSNETRLSEARLELSRAERQLVDFKKMYGYYMGHWQVSKLKYFATETQLYLNLIQVTTKRIETASHVIATSERNVS